MSSQAEPHQFMPSRHESRGPRASTHARAEVVRMLKEDHRLAKRAFREFDRLDAMDDAQACASLIQQTCSELEMHTRLEEDIFYPAVRAALAQTMLIDDAEVEHQTMTMLLDQVRSTAPGDPRQSASFRVLGEYVKHHVKEEEGEMFRQLSHAKLDWTRLLGEMQERRALLSSDVEDTCRTTYARGSGVALRQGSDGHGLRTERHS